MAVTDVDGRYQFVLPNDAAGTYRVGSCCVQPGVFTHPVRPAPPVRPGRGDHGCGRRETRSPRTITIMALFLASSWVAYWMSGDPVEGVVLRASQVRYVDGRRRLVDMARLGQPTDDLGRYRLAGLEPGENLVSAAVGQIDMRTPLVDLPGYGTTYFPGTPNPAEAQRVVVGRSLDVFGIDFPIARTRTVRVSGHAVDSRRAITGGIALTPSRRSGAIVATQMGAKIERDGRSNSQTWRPASSASGVQTPIGRLDRG